jgi:hypothetical protein
MASWWLRPKREADYDGFGDSIVQVFGREQFQPFHLFFAFDLAANR